jgi:hypothetical protein
MLGQRRGAGQRKYRPLKPGSQLNYKGVAAVGISAAFVVVMLVLMNLAIGGLGIQEGQTGTYPGVTTSCSASSGACGAFSLASANLTSTSYNDELEPANFTTLSLTLRTSGAGPVSSISVYLGSVAVGSIAGPFTDGTKAASFAVPATVIFTRGDSYTLRLVGLDAGGLPVVQETASVVAG